MSDNLAYNLVDNFIDDLKGLLVRKIDSNPKYTNCQASQLSANFAVIAFTCLIDRQDLKVRSLSYHINMYSDHLSLMIADLATNTYEYSDPSFPSNLLDRLGLN